MWGGANRLQRETVKVLRQLLEQVNKDISLREASLKALASSFDSKPSKPREDFEREMKEMRERGARQRQEDLEYRQRLLSTLDHLTEVLSGIAGKLDNFERK
jgi:hypothetical protein